MGHIKQQAGSWYHIHACVLMLLLDCLDPYWFAYISLKRQRSGEVSEFTLAHFKTGILINLYFNLKIYILPFQTCRVVALTEVFQTLYPTLCYYKQVPNNLFQKQRIIEWLWLQRASKIT